MRQGFVPLELYPRSLSRVWTAWPPEHRASVPDTRTWPDGDEPPDPEPVQEMWLLRSPWPGVSVQQVLTAAYRLVTLFEDWETNPGRAVPVIRDLLASDEAKVLRLWRAEVEADDADTGLHDG